MVFTFQSSTPNYKLFMGRDKFENEDLISFAFPEDVWFHVEQHSSAHVYVRMPLGQTDIESLPPLILKEAAQLTKQNSIEGCKAAEVAICYTMASNLNKTADMATGQVGFKQPKAVRHIRFVKTEKELLKSLEKTKAEIQADLCSERQARHRRDKEDRRQKQQETFLQQQQAERQRQEESDLRSYAALKQREPVMEYKGDGTIDSCRHIEEDFM